MVITLAGEPDAVAEAAFRGLKKAIDLIDLRKHQGEHKRMGAMDVCPFTPLGSATMEPSVEMAQVSMNLLDYQVTSIRQLFDAVATEAAAAGVEIAESEWVGLLPQPALTPRPQNTSNCAALTRKNRWLRRG